MLLYLFAFLLAVAYTLNKKNSYTGDVMQNDEALKQAIARFRSICATSGIKVTRQRLDIFRVVISSQEHPTADDVYRLLRLKLPDMSLDTVYRTLWLLNDLGLLCVVNPHRENLRFDANMQKHHHFICTKCGAIRDFYSSEMDTLSIPKETETLGKAITLHVEVRGICQNCLEANSETNYNHNNKQGENK